MAAFDFKPDNLLTMKPVMDFVRDAADEFLPESFKTPVNTVVPRPEFSHRDGPVPAVAFKPAPAPKPQGSIPGLGHVPQHVPAPAPMPITGISSFEEISDARPAGMHSSTSRLAPAS